MSEDPTSPVAETRSTDPMVHPKARARARKAKVDYRVSIGGGIVCLAASCMGVAAFFKGEYTVMFTLFGVALVGAGILNPYAIWPIRKESEE